MENIYLVIFGFNQLTRKSAERNGEMDTYERVVKILAEYTPEEARRRINSFFKYESPDGQTENAG